MAIRTHRLVIGVMGPASTDPQLAEVARNVGRGIASAAPCFFVMDAGG